MPAVLAAAAHQAQLAGFRLAGHEVDRAADGIRPVERGAAAVQHFDLLHRLERQRQVHRMVSRLRIADADSVDHHQRLVEARTANRKIGLRAVRPSFPEMHRAVLFQEVGERPRRYGRVLHGERANAAVHVGQLLRPRRARDDHGRLLLRG